MSQYFRAISLLFSPLIVSCDLLTITRSTTINKNLPNININGNSFFLPEKTTVSIVNNFSNVLKASLFIASPRTTIWEHALSDSTFLMIGNLGLIFSRGHSFSADSRFVEYRRRSTSTKARGITKDDVEKFAYRKLLMMACMAIENQALMT